MKILIVAATFPEIQPFEAWLAAHWERQGPGQYQNESTQIQLLTSGVGMLFMAFTMGKLLSLESYDLAINPGIAGALNRDLDLGQVVEVTQEYIADLGAETRDGGFLSAQELGFFSAEDKLFDQGWLKNPYSKGLNMLPQVSGISVNSVHGHEESIQALKSRVQAEVESMEGAAFFYGCLQNQVPFLEIRSISNYVEARNRAAWKVGLAIENLNQTLVELASTF